MEQDGVRRTVAGKYLIAADGGRTVAKQLNIGVSGPTNLVDMVSGNFTADLSAWRDPKVMISWFINPDLGGSVGTGFLYPIGPWDDSGHSREWNFVLAMGADDPQRLDEDAARDRVLRTLGIEGLPVTVHSVSHWYIQSVVADSFRARRCFLAGDAAHRVPQWGALGMNTGIGDVRNLCWKLAMALAEPALEGPSGVLRARASAGRSGRRDQLTGKLPQRRRRHRHCPRADRGPVAAGRLAQHRDAVARWS